MKARLLFSIAAAALLVAAGPHPAVADESAAASEHLSAAKKKNKPRRVYVRPAPYVSVPARGAFGYRSDPSFDPYGRPWRPNFYAPCYEDLGYGRFRDCSDIR